MHSLQAILEKEIGAVDRLVVLLDQERLVLEENRHEDLPALLTEKNALLLTLNQLETERSQLVSSLGFDGSADQFSKYIADSDQGKVLSPLLDQLKVKLEACFQKNRINGGIAELSAYCIDHSISVLRGTPDTTGLTYGPGGQKPPQAESQRTLGKV